MWKKTIIQYDPFFGDKQSDIKVKEKALTLAEFLSVPVEERNNFILSNVTVPTETKIGDFCYLIGCEVGDYVTAGRGVHISPKTKIGDRFIADVRAELGDLVEVGDYPEFGKYSEFGDGIKFGKEPSFGEGCYVKKITKEGVKTMPIKEYLK